MIRVFASFPSLLRRKSRMRLVRALVCVLAFAMVLANTAAVAMPFGAGDHGGTHSASMADGASGHCSPDTAARHAQAPHGEGCPCCDGKSCACAHVSGAMALSAPLIASIVVSTRLFAALPSRSYATDSVPPLRPPIA